jgi:hypothetical protein
VDGLRREGVPWKSPLADLATAEKLINDVAITVVMKNRLMRIQEDYTDAATRRKCTLPVVPSPAITVCASGLIAQLSI